MQDSERTFHTTDAPYVLPNDATEHERLELQTEAINRMMHDSPIRAPLRHPERILEVGCGTGRMTSYLATAYPSTSDVIGIDLSPVPAQKTPTKATFIQGDFRRLASNPDYPALAANSFDFIFSRMLIFGMQDWPAYISQAKSLLHPGGWLELQDVDFTYFDQDKQLLSNSWGWLRDQTAAWAEKGLDMYIGPKLERYMREAGFEDVRVEEFRWVFGRWEGHAETDMIGDYSTKYLASVNAGAYRKVLGPEKTEAELNSDLEEMKRCYEWSEEGKHKVFYVVCGRKP